MVSTPPPFALAPQADGWLLVTAALASATSAGVVATLDVGVIQARAGPLRWSAACAEVVLRSGRRLEAVATRDAAEIAILLPVAVARHELAGARVEVTLPAAPASSPRPGGAAC